MSLLFTVIRRTLAVALAAAALVLQSAPRVNAAFSSEPQVMYILPLYGKLIPSESNEAFAAQVAELRGRLGPEGPRVRLGFATYLIVNMEWTVDPGNPAAVRASLAPLVAQIDDVIAKGRANDIPVALSFLTAIRSSYDQAQLASQNEDRRVSQWHADNSLASYWWTHSRYARKQIRLREAYIRELGRVLANRMALYPTTLVAATGDGEIELSYEQAPPQKLEPPFFVADYSPFAVAEFRDWLRGAGLYAPGQPYAGQAYAQSARYGADFSPDQDTNNDGYWLNRDFGTSFTTWDLKHFDWKLADAVDARAIPASTYSAPGWNALPAESPTGFDPPRTVQDTAWWDTWDLFRQTMVYHHNLDFARWITTSPDAATGATVPNDRWFTDQIPADYLFGGTPDAPNERLLTSASPWWTADVAPYGSIGITSFNIQFAADAVARTLVNVAPVVAARNLPWALTEWNPGINKSTVPIPQSLYDDELALVERYRPRVVIPYAWGTPSHPVENSGFEVALKAFVDRIKADQPPDTRLTIEAPAPNATLIQPFNLTGWALDLGTVRGPGYGTGVDLVRVEAYRSPGPNVEPPLDPGAVSYGTTRNDIATTFGSQFFAPSGFSVPVNRLPVGTYDLVVSARSTVTGTFNASRTIRVTIVAPPGIPPQPFGATDTPADNTRVAGEVAVTGWALDDHGISAIEVFRNAVAGEPSANGLIFVGNAVRVAGARPDIAAGFPTLPDNDRAGWGLMVLSNMFPNQGTGIFTLTIHAKDLDGFSSLLGTRTIDARNSTSVIPFGTIDTPAQGATASGILVNFGWVLTPNPNFVPFDGTTIDVYVDGTLMGHPTYNVFRPDVAALFPNYANTPGPVGYLVLDTTRLANGVHTIFWIARDSAGNATGLGSRFFTVLN